MLRRSVSVREVGINLGLAYLGGVQSDAEILQENIEQQQGSLMEMPLCMLRSRQKLAADIFAWDD